MGVGESYTLWVAGDQSGFPVKKRGSEFLRCRIDSSSQHQSWTNFAGKVANWPPRARMAALRLRLQKEMFDVTEEQLLALAHVTNSQEQEKRKKKRTQSLSGQNQGRACLCQAC